MPPASATELAAALPSAAARRSLVDVLLIPACIEGEPTRAGEAVIRGFARALAVLERRDDAWQLLVALTTGGPCARADRDDREL